MLMDYILKKIHLFFTLIVIVSGSLELCGVEEENASCCSNTINAAITMATCENFENGTSLCKVFCDKAPLCFVALSSFTCGLFSMAALIREGKENKKKFAFLSTTFSMLSFIGYHLHILRGMFNCYHHGGNMQKENLAYLASSLCFIAVPFANVVFSMIGEAFFNESAVTGCQITSLTLSSITLLFCMCCMRNDFIRE